MMSLTAKPPPEAQPPIEDEPTAEQIRAIDELAKHAIREYRAGRTISFDALLEELNISVDDVQLLRP